MELPKGSPWGIIVRAVKKIPALKYLLGVAALIAVVALWKGYELNPYITIAGGIVAIFFMVVIYLFAQLVSKGGEPIIVWAAYTFMWTMLVIFILSSFCLFSSVFFGYPIDLRPSKELGSQKFISPKKQSWAGSIRLNGRPLIGSEVTFTGKDITKMTDKNGYFEFEIDSTSVDSLRANINTNDQQFFCYDIFANKMNDTNFIKIKETPIRIKIDMTREIEKNIQDANSYYEVKKWGGPAIVIYRNIIAENTQFQKVMSDTIRKRIERYKNANDIELECKEYKQFFSNP